MAQVDAVYDRYFQTALDGLKADGSYRHFAELERRAGQFPHAYHHGLEREITVWCSNDYLGMGQHPDVLKAMHESLDRSGAGAGGTRNISGTNHEHVALERELADLHGKEAALLFNSGYLSNWATLGTIAARLKGCVVLSDAANHASMIEGIRHSRAEKMIFAHNDVVDLEEKLKSLPLETPKIIAFESVYSMDGDIAPIEAICDLADRYNALTYLDEVHAVGLYGHQGGGVAEERGIAHRLSVIEGTLVRGSVWSVAISPAPQPCVILFAPLRRDSSFQQRFRQWLQLERSQASVTCARARKNVWRIVRLSPGCVRASTVPTSRISLIRRTSSRSWWGMPCSAARSPMRC